MTNEFMKINQKFIFSTSDMFLCCLVLKLIKYYLKRSLVYIEITCQYIFLTDKMCNKFVKYIRVFYSIILNEIYSIIYKIFIF